jgi:hypothetical protein
MSRMTTFMVNNSWTSNLKAYGILILLMRVVV